MNLIYIFNHIGNIVVILNGKQSAQDQLYIYKYAYHMGMNMKIFWRS